jgi:TonB family protein
MLYATGFRTSVETNECGDRTGVYVFYDKKRHKLREGEYSNGSRIGTWKHYYPNSDALYEEYRYLEDERLDYSLTFDSASHNRQWKTIYLDSNKSETWKYNGEDSVLQKRIYVDSGDIKITITQYGSHSETRKERVVNGIPEATCYDETGKLIPCTTEESVFVYTEQMPEAGFSIPLYLKKNMKYPKEALKKEIGGRVIVKFVVDEDGCISKVKVVEGIGWGCNEEAQRVVEQMPCWEQPGMQNGRPVRVYFTLPITFLVK